MIKPLYVQRRLQNTQQLSDWARSQGFELCDEPHVTVAYSTEPVNWDDFKLRTYDLMVPRNFARKVVRLGKAVVITLTSDILSDRWRYFRKAGASWDFEQYTPHISVAYDQPDLDVDSITPFYDDLYFGGEIAEHLVEDWA